MGKYTIWILLALIAYVLFRDKISAAVLGTGRAIQDTIRPPVYGPSPTGNTYANTSPGTISPGPQAPPPKNVWDVIGTAITTGGAAYDTYELNH